MKTVYECTREERVMLQRALAEFSKAPSTLMFNGRVAAIREMANLPEAAQLRMPDCGAFVMPGEPPQR